MQIVSLRALTICFLLFESLLSITAIREGSDGDGDGGIGMGMGWGWCFYVQDSKGATDASASWCATCSGICGTTVFTCCRSKRVDGHGVGDGDGYGDGNGHGHGESILWFFPIF